MDPNPDQNPDQARNPSLVERIRDKIHRYQFKRESDRVYRRQIDLQNHNAANSTPYVRVGPAQSYEVLASGLDKEMERTLPKRMNVPNWERNKPVVTKGMPELGLSKSSNLVYNKRRLAPELRYIDPMREIDQAIINIRERLNK